MKRLLKNKNVLLTGANAGLGWSMLQQLLPVVSRIIAVDKNTNNLLRLALENPEKIVVLQLDLSDAAAVKNFSENLQEYAIDLFINNAGITLINTFEETDLAKLRQVMEVNYFAPITITKSLLGCGLESIININSVAGFAPLYARSAYVSSKFALNGFMKTLATETKLEVLNVYPSFINTGIRTQAKSVGEKSFVVRNKSFLNPEQVSAKILTAWKRNKSVLRIGFTSKAVHLLIFFAPRFYNYLMKRKNQNLWRK